MKLNSVLLKSTVVAALGGLLFGFDTAVISGTTGQLSQVFHLSSKSLGITVSIAIWGTVCRCHARRVPRGTFWAARQLANNGALLSGLCARLCPGLELVVSRVFSLHRRPWHWWLIGAGPDVHRGGRSREMARKIGRDCFNSMSCLEFCSRISPTTLSR